MKLFSRAFISLLTSTLTVKASGSSVLLLEIEFHRQGHPHLPQRAPVQPALIPAPCRGVTAVTLLLGESREGLVVMQFALGALPWGTAEPPQPAAAPQNQQTAVKPTAEVASADRGRTTVPFKSQLCLPLTCTGQGCEGRGKECLKTAEVGHL